MTDCFLQLYNGTYAFRKNSQFYSFRQCSLLRDVREGCVVMRDTTRGNEAKQRDYLNGNNYSTISSTQKEVKVVLLPIQPDLQNVVNDKENT